MAEEKILEEEVLNEDELEGVAGGTAKEAFADREQLNKLGLYNFDKEKGFVGSLQDGFNALGKKIGLTLNVKSESSLNSQTANVYKIGNQTLTHDQFWNTVNRLMPKE